jgi:hypothetical protein
MLEKKSFVKKNKFVIICNFPNVLNGIGTQNLNFWNSMMAILRKNNACL